LVCLLNNRLGNIPFKEKIMSDGLFPEVVEEVAEKKRTRRKKEALIVIEHGLEIEEPLLYERLEEAAGKLAKNGELIVSVPKELDGDSLTSWLRSHGFDLTPLNIWTNPHLEDNDGRRRSGWICRPRS
jgi:hypothetical protein